MIRGTLIMGLNYPHANHVLTSQAQEGLQSLSDPKERKGLKEAHFALGLRPSSIVQPIRTPSNPRNNPRLARGLLAGALNGARNSASLEGSEPTLGREGQLRLAQGYPSAEGTGDPSAHPPAVRRH